MKNKLINAINRKYNKYSNEPTNIYIRFEYAKNNQAEKTLIGIYKFMEIIDKSIDSFKTDSLKIKTRPKIDSKILKIIKDKKFYEFMLKGPPDYGIDKRKADIWINSQFCELFRESAEKLVENTIHISHKDILTQLKNLAKKSIKIYRESIILIGGNTSKSNYFFSIFFMSIMYHEYNMLPFDISVNFIESFRKYGTLVNYLDIDDMMYTGTQTTSTLSGILLNTDNPMAAPKDIITSALFPKIAKMVYDEFPNFENYAIFIKINEKSEDKYHILQQCIILFLEHYYMLKKGLKYYVMRLFMSTYSKYEIKNSYLNIIPIIVVNEIKIPNMFSLMTNEFIRNIDDFYKEKNFMSLVYYYIVTYYLNIAREIPATSCYSDYKIADEPSTFLVIYANGSIPTHKDFLSLGSCPDGVSEPIHDVYKKGQSNKISEKDRARLAKDVIKYVNERISIEITREHPREVPICMPFIKNCNTVCKDLYNHYFDSSEIERCPSSFYKKINYN